MPLIRRKWSPAEADTWAREDWFAIVLSPLCYVGLAIGVALSLLVIPIGFIVLCVTVVLILLMHWIIDPKLKQISSDFEAKQKHYLEELEKIERWEDIS